MGCCPTSCLFVRNSNGICPPRELVRQISVQMTGALRHQRFRYEDMGFQEGQGGSREAAGPAVNVMMFHEAIRLGDVVGEFHVLTSGPPTEDLFFSIYPSIAGGERSPFLRSQSAPL